MPFLPRVPVAYTPPPFNPLSLSPALWYDAQSVAGLADGASITTEVADRSGNGRTCLDSGSGHRATWQATGFGGGKPSVRFDGSAAYLKTPSFTLSQPYTLYGVWKLIARGASGNRLWDSLTVNNSVFNDSNLGQMSVYFGTAFTCKQTPPGGGRDATPSGVGFPAWCVVTANGASSSVSICGLPNATGNPGSAGTTTGFVFGCAGNLTQFFSNYDLGEFLAFSGTHTAQQQKLVIDYFKSRWPTLPDVGVRRQLVCDGDSLTAGVGVADATTQSYPPQLRSLYNGPNSFNLYNFGIAGQTTSDINSDASTQIDILYDSAMSSNFCLVWAGTNDLVAGTSPATVYNNLKTYWAARRSAGWKVVAFTALPRSAPGVPAGFEADRQTLNTSIRSDSSLYDAIVDLAADSRIGDSGDELNTTYYDGDKTHLNQAGYAIVASLAQAALAPLLP